MDNLVKKSILNYTKLEQIIDEETSESYDEDKLFKNETILKYIESPKCNSNKIKPKTISAINLENINKT